ncbi:thioredoxin domain-containing protein [Sulfitobacter geojensis]|uniref:thioredoxin domain-containing protein n=1 Tax=Sulfitobacter geojensis TaxID=1342299 RepID=UPI0036DB5B3F
MSCARLRVWLAWTTKRSKLACKTPTRHKTLVAWFEENKNRDDITSTPSFLINGTKQSNMAYGDMKALIEAELES